MLDKVKTVMKSWWFGSALAGAAAIFAWIFFGPLAAGIAIGVGATMFVQGVREVL